MPPARKPKRAKAVALAHKLVVVEGLSRGQATRALVEAGLYEGARDYPSSGWITALLRAHKERRESRTRELLETKVTPPAGRLLQANKSGGGGEASADVTDQERPTLAPEHEGIEEKSGFEENSDGATVWSKSKRIKTLEHLLEVCAVDLSVWQVDHYVVNTWENAAKVEEGVVVTTLYQVKAWLSRRKLAPVEDALKDLITQLGARAPKLPAPRGRARPGRYLLVPNLYDLHLNKRSYDGAYTIEQATAEFKSVIDAVVQRVHGLGMPVERVLFPAGNDALHADNLAGTTTKGTQLELAGSQRDAVKALIEAYRYAIQRLRTLAPVDVVAVESNHDRYSVAWLGATLEALFCKADGVTVDAVNYPRKYYRYGVTLLGLEHGDGTKPRDLAPLMAQEAPQEWAQTRYRQWLRGHVHHSAGMYYPITSDGGVTTRVIPALCPPDEYHVLHGFVGGHRAAEVMFFDRTRGPAGEFSVFVDEVAIRPHGREITDKAGHDL